MRIFNEDKTQEIQDYNKELYYLKDDKLFIKHHEAVEEIKQISHLEIVRKNEKTGGVEYQEIIDVPYKPANEAYDEYEDIQIIVPYTQAELNQRRIIELKQLLKDTDYQAIKFAEGELTAEEYAETKEQRRAWRKEINKLEGGGNE